MSPNRLATEKSPYLLQHKNNPVHWYPWGEEAFEAARRENKPIFLSIGYSTCYWCHVMEKDSFEIQEVGDALNQNFISIKVDREEHPDVDQIYMEAVMGMTGRGGWPMSVFLTPDLKPFFGGTYFPRHPFLQILGNISHTWHSEPEKVLSSGETLANYLQEHNGSTEAKPVTEALLKQVFLQFQKSFDPTYGGFGEAPKFPHSMSLSLLLRIHRRTGNPEALAMVTKSLDEMARGGLYDHLGGGFHRYSTDERWLVPHFEKMLYDNALLAWTYLEGYQVTGNKDYANVARSTLNYVLRDMTHPEGGFYSAEDAGEVGKEGEFYVWREPELASLLDADELAAFKKTYNISGVGNFEHGTNILHLTVGVQNFEPLQRARQKVFAARTKRPRPRLDDKILTTWNGLMIAAFAKGFQVLGDQRYLDAARQAARFIEKNLWRKGAHVGAPHPPEADQPSAGAAPLLRRYRDGEGRFGGTVNDYAFLIHGLLELYASDFDPAWLVWAQQLQAKQDELFWDTQLGGYFYTAADERHLILRKKETYDGALPSGNSIALLNLLRLRNLTYDQNYEVTVGQLLAALSGEISRYPAGYAQALIGVDYFLDDSKEIAVVGPKGDLSTQVFQEFLHGNFLPNQVMAFGTPGSIEPKLLVDKVMKDGKTTIYVCQNKTCQAPTTNLEEAKALATTFKKFNL